MEVDGDTASESPISASGQPLQPQNPARAPHQVSRRNTRAHAACDACRSSKTRCDSGRPVCAKCARRGVSCVYPDADPFSLIETWSVRILDAVERQERLVQSQGRLVAENCSIIQSFIEHQNQQSQQNQPQQHQRQQYDSPRQQYRHGATIQSLEEEDVEAASRNDALNTPITGADTILSWPIFPADKPVSTFPASAYSEKPDLFQPAIPPAELGRMRELRNIYLTKFHPKCCILDSEQLDADINQIAEEGFDWSVSSCLVLLVFALAAVWGNFPEDDTRTVPCTEPSASHWATYISLSVPECRMKEALGYIAMARKRMTAAFLDDTLRGVQCWCLYGHWYMINIEPIQGWKTFRTASMLWQTYNLKYQVGKWQRSQQEESLEQRLYWTLLKSECEIRYELASLPPSNLLETNFPFPFPNFLVRDSNEDSGNAMPAFSEIDSLSSYFGLAEISMRRLLNRIRNAVGVICPEIDTPAIYKLSDDLFKLENQLQQWVRYLPSQLQFHTPLESEPPSNEAELVKLLRERYVEVRELLCRSYLYLCIHCKLDPALAESYGIKASECLALAVYRIRTENPFFRHPGSWGACRVRFNHAMCLIAAYRAKSCGTPATEHIDLPANWAECVQTVIERLKIWSEEGAGIKELSILLEWLMHLR